MFWEGHGFRDLDKIFLLDGALRPALLQPPAGAPSEPLALDSPPRTAGVYSYSSRRIQGVIRLGGLFRGLFYFKGG